MSISSHPAEVNIPGAFPEDPVAAAPTADPGPSSPPRDQAAGRTWWPLSLLQRTGSQAGALTVPPSPTSRAPGEKTTTDATAIPASPSNPSIHKPCTCRDDGRNLVVCIDGTSNQFSVKNTNVVELYSRLVKDRGKQRTFYNSGIGTYAEQSWKSWDYYMQVIAHNVDLAIAWRFERILLSAYLWLSQNYREGDRIFLFGFSRGAYQVRALSAMIESVGLIHKGNEDQIPFAYQLYAEMNPAQATVRRKARFKQTFSRTVRVHFIGARDTVSSVGIVRGKTLPGTTDGMKHVCYFRHALALHERRVKFLPEYVRGGLGPEVDPAEDPKTLHTKEVWFAGSHSDIGGGAEENDELDKFGPSLRWMSIEATQFGLLLDPAPRRWEAAKISQSLTGVWKLFEYAPILRLSYTAPEATMLWPHLGKARVIQSGQRVHKSLTKEIELEQNLAGDQDMSRYEVEPDPYSTVGRIYHEKKTAEAQSLTHEDIKVLSFFTETESGRQLLRDVALELEPTASQCRLLYNY
ncbi:hypothetical protein EXIGLDRAFT_831159 [Exidia glandulosa HHB12029]|uniref:T6SS Phospholipase effector Tle1-like catalytic domain-containing protein n=1 Tax=Exidia glandulosa HHB12029 TaxID=1314781 RepID=A0A165MY27_EXIGL|nr:hypothetical protein EXIGLDRAFT_831159 [Exidia glandulosa HHB12029]